MLTRSLCIASLLSALALGGCGGSADAPVDVGFGQSPQLPPPDSTLVPTVNIATANRWQAGQLPTPADGLRVVAMASGLVHPRWLHVLPNGDVLVAETNAPPRPDAIRGVRGFFMKRAMKQSGAAVPSANRLSILRDADGDGVAEIQQVFLEGLNSPFGMALINSTLYVANTDAIVAFDYAPGSLSIDGPGRVVTPLPAGTRNWHWTKNLIASPDGTKLYATVGSNSNIAEHGLEQEEGRAAIWEVDVATGKKRLFATGLRNPNGMDFEPQTGKLWTVVNERDELGHNLVPDYATSVSDGDFFGWPWSYFGDTVDVRVKPAQPAKVATARRPDYGLGAHTASLGLTFATGAKLGEALSRGMFIGQHGSWNRKPHSGYKVIFVPFADGMPAGSPVDVLAGFLVDDEARGRPVDVRIARDGALLVADDVGDVIWRVSREP
ncbi:MAG: sorbosone dehydrogenase family protein [Gammaproteobacteria bacterium]